ncbi:gluconokinase [soil metagenome]
MIIIVMGVTGCGKTTVGRALAKKLSCKFFDADDFHPAANREKLKSDIPLDDTDRWPWLQILADLLKREGAAGATVVLACSALKQSYRDILRSCGYPVKFVHVVGTQERITARLRERAGGHELIRDFDRILTAQFRDLEPPADAVVVDNEKPVAAIVEELLRDRRIS